MGNPGSVSKSMLCSSQILPGGGSSDQGENPEASLYQRFIVLRMLPVSNLMLMKAISFVQKHQARKETNLILQIKSVCPLHVVERSQL